MRKHQLLAVACAISAAVALAACNKSGGDNPAAVQAAKDEAAIKASEAQMVTDLKAKDVEKVVGFYASSAVLLVPGQTPTKGSDQLRWVFKQMFADPNFKLSFDAQRVQIAGSNDIAYTQGTYASTGSDPVTHQAKSETGSYVTIFRKAANGSWKAIEDINTPTASAPAAPTGPVTAGTLPKSMVEPTAEGEVVKAADAAWATAWKARDVAKIAAVYTADAVAMLPGAPAMVGSKAIADGLAAALKDPAYTVAFTPDQVMVAASGELAYTRGTFTEIHTDAKTNKPVQQKGAYLTVWRREADGSWKAVQDIATPGAEPASAVVATK